MGEWAIAILATVLIVGLHVRNVRHAGPLWRDEAQTATLAALPGWSDIWQAMPQDSFPPLATLIVREWGAAFGDGDQSLRQFGCVVGLSILVAFWAGSLALYRAPPSIALALWGLNPVAIRYGDAVRPYGLGALAIVVAFLLVARWMLRPTWLRGACACAALVASVQTVYSNAVLVAAVVLAAMLVALAARRWWMAAVAFAMGCVAALSLTPYLAQVRAAGEWSALTLVDVDLSNVLRHFGYALAKPSGASLWLWGGLSIVAVVRATQAVWHNGHLSEGVESRDIGDRLVVACAIICAGLAAAGMLLFLWQMRVAPQGWHFLPTLALLAVCLDSTICGTRFCGLIRTTALALGLALGMTANLDFLDARQSNVDRIADRLNERAEPGDLIIVSPWYIGATFHRYYHGAAPWTTLPPLEETKLHRFDLLKQKMIEREPLSTLFAEIETSLRTGHRVWLVGGGWLIVPPDSKPPEIAPAPHPDSGWFAQPYLATWLLQTVVFLHTHRSSYSPVLLEGSEPISNLEGFELWVAKGWNP